MRRLLAGVLSLVIAGGVSSSAAYDSKSCKAVKASAETNTAEITATADEDTVFTESSEASEAGNGPVQHMAGDVDGDGVIDITDVVNIINHINGVSALEGSWFYAADMNGDNSIDIEDAVIIMEMICGEDRNSEPEPEPEPEKPIRSMQIDFNVILQNPQLPTGCEITSLTMALNHEGFKVDKLTMARKYLPKQDFYWYNGRRYGADFRYVFAGNPENSWSYGCYAPCIVTAGNKYLADVGSDCKVKDLSGTEFEDLLTNYINKSRPVMIWVTSSNLHAMYYTDSWYTPDGNYLTWKAYEHCVVLTGYDLDKKVVYAADPLYGNKTYPMDTFKQRYNDLGKNSAVIEKAK